MPTVLLGSLTHRKEETEVKEEMEKTKQSISQHETKDQKRNEGNERYNITPKIGIEKKKNTRFVL